MEKTTDKAFLTSLIVIVSIVAIVAVIALTSSFGNYATPQGTETYSAEAPVNTVGQPIRSSDAISTQYTKPGVTRKFNPSSASSNKVVKVSLRVSVPSNSDYYLIEENVPAGVIILDTGSGTQVGNTIRWANIQGATSTTLSYKVKTPFRSGTYIFFGQYAMGGMSYPKEIGGHYKLIVNRGKNIVSKGYSLQTYQIINVDTNGDDCVSLSEIAAYTQHWLNGRVTIKQLAYSLGLWRQGC